MEKYLIHSNELHLIDKAKIHQAVEKMVESLDMAAGSTSCFDLYKVEIPVVCRGEIEGLGEALLFGDYSKR